MSKAKKPVAPVVKEHKKSIRRDLTIYTMDKTLQRMVNARTARKNALTMEE